MYGIDDSSWGTDLFGAFVSAATGYAVTSAAKMGLPGTALIAEGVLGVGGIALDHTDAARRHPYLRQTLRAFGYGGFFGVGAWAGEATTTFGNHGPAAAPFWQPTVAAAAGGVKARVEALRRAAGGARAGALGETTTQPPVYTPSPEDDLISVGAA